VLEEAGTTGDRALPAFRVYVEGRLLEMHPPPLLREKVKTIRRKEGATSLT